MFSDSRIIWRIWREWLEGVAPAAPSTLAAAFVAVAVSVSALGDPPGDPWPFWQRTPNRLGNTQTIGPRSATLDWSALYTTAPNRTVAAPSLVLHRAGLLIAGSTQGVAALDPITHEMLWEQITSDSAGLPAIAEDRVLLGTTPVPSGIHCFDIFTGTEIWFRPADHIRSAPVIRDGIVFVTDGGDREVLALDLSSGELVWSLPTKGPMYDSPSLDWPTLLTSAGTPDASVLAGLDPVSGASRWTFDTSREIFGTAVIRDGVIHFASTDRWLYAVDAGTGLERWRFWTEQENSGAVCLGHDGTVVTATTGNVGLLFAVTPDGQQLWRKVLPGLVSDPPIIDGEGRIYVTSSHWTGSSYEARIHAFLPDGTEQWAMLMPDDCRSSPTLGPDGTLYILCRDHNVYAFRDPHTRATLTNLNATTGTILDGGLADLEDVDDAVLHTRSGFGRQFSEFHKTALTIHATVADPTPSILRLQIKSWINHPAGLVTVRLRNQQTNQMETVRTYQINDDKAFEWIQIPEGGNAPAVDPARYIRLTGAIEMEIRHVVFVPIFAFQFDSFFDQVKIETTG